MKPPTSVQWHILLAVVVIGVAIGFLLWFASVVMAGVADAVGLGR